MGKKRLEPPYADLMRENNRLRKLVVANVDAYAERITAERNQNKLDRKYVQRQAQKACRYLENGHSALAREFMRPLESGNYGEQHEQNTPVEETRHASTTPYLGGDTA